MNQHSKRLPFRRLSGTLQPCRLGKRPLRKPWGKSIRLRRLRQMRNQMSIPSSNPGNAEKGGRGIRRIEPGDMFALQVSPGSIESSILPGLLEKTGCYYLPFFFSFFNNNLTSFLIESDTVKCYIVASVISQILIISPALNLLNRFCTGLI